MNEMDRERRDLARQRRQNAAAKAAELLSFYMQQVYAAAGLKWDGDNEAELGTVVDLIIEAASEDV
jgi:hypothetical protein